MFRAKRLETAKSCVPVHFFDVVISFPIAVGVTFLVSVALRLLHFLRHKRYALPFSEVRPIFHARFNAVAYCWTFFARP